MRATNRLHARFGQPEVFDLRGSDPSRPPPPPRSGRSGRPGLRASSASRTEPPRRDPMHLAASIRAPASGPLGTADAPIAASRRAPSAPARSCLWVDRCGTGRTHRLREESRAGVIRDSRPRSPSGPPLRPLARLECGTDETREHTIDGAVPGDRIGGPCLHAQVNAARVGTQRLRSPLYTDAGRY
jgi:hypothetical protein